MQTIILGAAALFLVGPAAQAGPQDTYDQGTYDDASQTAPMTVEETFTKMDTDASGGVDEVEFVAFAGEGSETQFSAIAGDDGTITLDELSAYMAELAGEAPSDG